MKFIKLWLIPILLSIGIFALVRPTLAQLGELQLGLADYLLSGNVLVGSEVGNSGFPQIYYEWDGQKNFITDNNYSNEAPNSEGEYITWMSQINGVWQIYLYNLISGNTVQLTNSGNNANPKVGGGKVVWEGWVNDEEGGKWQIYFFDGMRVEQLTSGDLSLNPEINGDFVTYSRKDITGTYRSVIYSIGRKVAKEINTGISAKYPNVRNGKILLSNGKEDFPLTAEDLFTLDLAPLSATDSAALTAIADSANTVTLDDIAQELSASASARTETGLSLTPSPTPFAETPTPE